MSVTFIPTVSVLTCSPHTSMTAYLAFTRLGSKKQTGDRPVLAADPRSTWPSRGPPSLSPPQMPSSTMR